VLVCLPGIVVELDLVSHHALEEDALGIQHAKNGLLPDLAVITFSQATSWASRRSLGVSTNLTPCLSRISSQDLE